LAAARAGQDRPMAVLSSLPEGLPETVAADLIAQNIVPLNGMDPALQAIAAVAGMVTPSADPLLLPKGSDAAGQVLHEAEAKAALAQFGLKVPGSLQATSVAEAVAQAGILGYPVVLKAAGLAHKSEAGGVALNLKTSEEVRRAAEAMPAGAYLVEQMLADTVAELLIGVTCDPAHGYVLTLAAGGVMTEVLQDSAHLLIPASRDEVAEAVQSLKMAPVLAGFRGNPAADHKAIFDAVAAVQAYVIATQPAELDINPLICTPHGAVAADALIKTGGHDDPSHG
ncbi:MAG: acetate--CoA ligase family protein, partial [Pseudomonadota bacterium]|nr:acetate--CoA ligase family protein [Pseudomonadota bacterium]